MLKHEKKAFIKFFATYFGSVSLLILISGFFYFQDKEKMMIQKEHFSMIEYVRQFKMKQLPSNNHTISIKILHIKIPNFNMDNFTIKDNYFEKYMPYNWDGDYILVKKDKNGFNKNISKIKIQIISIQIILLLLFAYLSYYLSMRALKPMKEAIVKLDNFSKDLIHDLNTPITSILLNMKILEKDINYRNNKPINRIKKNIEDISELHNNLTVLLQEDTMVTENQNIVKIVEDVISTHQKIYLNIKYIIEVESFYANINTNAFTQILINLISNASKYNKNNGYVRIYAKNKTLYIKDNGIGIKNPKEIFNRSYTEQKNGTGIGLDITKRLCEAMNINIYAISQPDIGSTVHLEF